MPRSIDDQFAAWSDDQTSTAATFRDQTNALSVGSAPAPAPHVNGQIAGIPVATTVALRLDQLEVVPQDTLYSQFVLNDDDASVVAYANSLKTVGNLAQHLMVWPTNRVKTVGNEDLVIYQVLHDPYQFAAWRLVNGITHVWCDIPQAEELGEVLLSLLATRQHQHPQSLIEKCDLVRHLRDDLGMSNTQIVAHLTFNSEEGDPPTEGYVSQLYAISTLPAPVRRDIHSGVLLFSHARELARIGSDETACCLFAQLVTQDSQRMPVMTLSPKITEVLHGRYEIVQQGGRVICRPAGALRLVSDRAKATGSRVTMFYTQTWAAAEPQIVRYVKQFKPNITLVAGAQPNMTSITPQSLGTLTAQLNALKGNIPLPVVEALLIGYVEAAHRLADEGGYTNSQGLLAPETGDLAQEA